MGVEFRPAAAWVSHGGGPGWRGPTHLRNTVDFVFDGDWRSGAYNAARRRCSVRSRNRPADRATLSRPVNASIAARPTGKGHAPTAREVEALGYVWDGAYGIAGWRYHTFADAFGVRAARLHFFRADSRHAVRHIAFRDDSRALIRRGRLMHDRTLSYARDRNDPTPRLRAA